jgi:hypothetical protein
VEVRYLVEKRNICDAHIFTRSLVQTCRLESTSLCLHTRLRVKNKFPNSHYLFYINANVWLLCAHLLMTSIILHSPKSVNKMSVMHLIFMFHLIFFAFWGSDKLVFHIAPFRPTNYILKCFWYLEVRNRVRIWNKVKKNLIRGVETSIMPIGYTNIHIQNNVSEYINKQSFIPVLCIYSCK